MRSKEWTASKTHRSIISVAENTTIERIARNWNNDFRLHGVLGDSPHVAWISGVSPLQNHSSHSITSIRTTEREKWFVRGCEKCLPACPCLPSSCLPKRANLFSLPCTQNVDDCKTRRGGPGGGVFRSCKSYVSGELSASSNRNCQVLWDKTSSGNGQPVANKVK